MVFKTYISVRYLNSIMHERIKGKISSIISFENIELLKRNSRIFENYGTIHCCYGYGRS